MSFLSTNSAHTDPHYWWKQAEQCEASAQLFAKHYKENEAFKKDLCDKCHGVLERELKALLAERGLLTDGYQQTHSLNKLLEGLPEIKLTRHQEDFLYWFSNMHISANYPYEEENLNVWSSDSKMATTILRYNELNEKFKRLRICDSNANNGRNQKHD